LGKPPDQPAAKPSVRSRLRSLAASLAPACLVLAAALSAPAAWAQGRAELPDAPVPDRFVPLPALPTAGTCQVRNEGGVMAATAVAKSISIAGYGDVAGALPNQPVLMTVPCPIYVPMINWYKRFLDGPKVKPLTPKEKAWLAIRNVTDPFNAVTILGTSGIGVAADSHSAYGPGFPGFARSVGVAYTQDMTGEFFGTFLIPSIVHQDPHYHREPHQSIKHRIGHAILQVVWTQGDNGKGMLNYADLVGFAIDDEVSNLYVPGRETNMPASAQRYGIGLALAPTDNFITEFVPDIASHIHVQVVFVQRIINQVAKTGGSGS
jgi:hypothetical protein